MTDQLAPGTYDGTGGRSAQWWPTRYGAEDELGAGHELTPERTLAALRIPKEGRIIELAQLLEPGIPAYPPRAWHQLVLAHGGLEETMLAARHHPGVVLRGAGVRRRTRSAATSTGSGTSV